MQIFKIIISGVFALIILTFLSYFYYNYPLRVITKGITKREANVFYSQASEGFGYGKTNNDGCINIFDYNDRDLIKILIIGSSHMEGRQMKINDIAASRLNALYGGGVYNTGISGQHFLLSAQNIQNLVKKYSPSNFVIIETNGVNFSDNDLRDTIKNMEYQNETNINISGILYLFTKNQFLRLIYKQFNGYFIDKQKQNKILLQNNFNNPELLKNLLIKMRDAANFSGAKLIIAYHPGIAINDDGSMKIIDDEKITAQFKKVCEENEIYFLNTGERFLNEYKKIFTLPYGFWNTSVGSGHMNAEGHRMFAEEIFNLIKKIQAN